MSEDIQFLFCIVGQVRLGDIYVKGGEAPLSMASMASMKCLYAARNIVATCRCTMHRQLLRHPLSSSTPAWSLSLHRQGGMASMKSTTSGYAQDCACCTGDTKQHFTWGSSSWTSSIFAMTSSPKCLYTRPALDSLVLKPAM